MENSTFYTQLLKDKDLCIRLKNIGFDCNIIAQFRGNDIEPVTQMHSSLNPIRFIGHGDDTNYWLGIPTYDQVFEWFRVAHREFITIIPSTKKADEYYYSIIQHKPYHVIVSDDMYNDYDDCRIEAIECCLSILEDVNMLLENGEEVSEE